MSISILCFLIVLMIWKTKESICGLVSIRTGTILCLGFPVLSFIQSFVTRYVDAECSFEVRKDDLLVFIYACFCILGLVGVEKKNTSLLKPILVATLILIVSALCANIGYLAEYFQFNLGRFSSHFTAIQFQYGIIFQLVIMYAATIVFSHYSELLSQEQVSNAKPPISV